jgi:hypothetical protein
LDQPDALGNRILDASCVGYQGGAVPLPSSNTVPVKVVVSPVAGDNVANIQVPPTRTAAMPSTTPPSMSASGANNTPVRCRRVDGSSTGKWTTSAFTSAR